MPGQREIYNKVINNFNEQEIIDHLSEMIKIPSHKNTEFQEDKMASYLFDYFTVNKIEDIQLDYIEENRPNIIVKLPGKGNGNSMMLNGHLDTIPPYNMIIPPYEPIINNGYIQGRGAVDMKGSLAAMSMAMVLIQRAGIILEGDLYFTGVIDQEQRSLGMVKLVEDKFKTDYAIVGEPTNLKICSAHKGMEWIKIVVKGKSSHGSTPDKGYNPIYHVCRIAEEIEKLNMVLKDRYNNMVGYPTINVGVINGGNDPNIVPNVSYLEVDRRYTPDENLEDIYEELQRIIARLNTVYPHYRTEIISMNDRVCPLRNIPLATDTDNLLVNSLQKIIKEQTGKEGEITAFRGWSDAALLKNKLNIDSVVFGPGLLEDAHVVDESLKIADLIRAVKIYVATILDICY